MLFRAVLLLAVVLIVPLRVHAARYVVRAGDSLSAIAERYHVSVQTLARLNRIGGSGLIRIGQVLYVPSYPQTSGYGRQSYGPDGYGGVWYHVRWGDTLSGIAARYGLSLPAIRSLNPSFGGYLLAGQYLRVRYGGGSGAPTYTASVPTTSASGSTHGVQPGDTLSGIAARYGTTVGALLAANRLLDPNRIMVGTVLTIPAAGEVAQGRVAHGGYDPWSARSLIAGYAQRYGLNPSLPLAVAYEESGFNQGAISQTGAVGVMQVEPYTGRHVGRLLGRPVNLYNLDDNIHAGVYWLAQLVSYYGGNERPAAAAYYEGTRNLERRGLFDDTVQYVNNVLALKNQFGG